MLFDAVTTFAREFALNDSLLPKSLRSWCGVALAAGVLAFPGAVTAGYTQASEVISARIAKQLQPMIDTLTYVVPAAPSEGAP